MAASAQRPSQDLRHRNMRLGLLVYMVILSACIQAQNLGQVELDEAPKTVYFKTNPLSLLSGTFPLYSGELKGLAEIVISERVTYNLGASLIFKAPWVDNGLGFPLASGQDNSFWGYRFQGEFRYYYLKFTNQNRVSKLFIPNGLYASIHGSYATATFRDKTIRFPSVEFVQVDVNALAGMQLMISDALGLDVYMGLGYKNYAISRVVGANRTIVTPFEIGYFNSYYWPIKFKLGTSLVFGLF